MKLTSEHKEAVATWVAAGATLNEIQDRLKNELGVTLTFMDTRFLLSDLGLTLKPEAGEEDDAEVLDVGGAETGVGGAMGDAGILPGDEGDSDGLSGVAQVRVTVDVVTVPGTMVSGKVTFTDGVTAGWYLDQMGQLGLSGVDRTYQPPEADVAAFQRELQRALR
jgi:hypothetical protein